MGLAREGRGGGIGAQNTHGESNPAHFFVKPLRQRLRSVVIFPGQVPLQALRCLLSVQEARKLMQKIHSLTDN
jgi:hypothetical protein